MVWKSLERMGAKRGSGNRSAGRARLGMLVDQSRSGRIPGCTWGFPFLGRVRTASLGRFNRCTSRPGGFLMFEFPLSIVHTRYFISVIFVCVI